MVTAETAGDAVPFSRSNLWLEQRRFYCDEGVAAWRGKVPHHITSNPVIAHSYALLVARVLEDRRREGGGPVCILELGSGPGLFGYHFIHRLLDLLEPHGLEGPPFVYVMSDLAERNVAFWREHPALRDLVERGVLDFAVFDVGSSRSLELLESGRVLAADRPADGPLIVFANYVFDTLPQDIFQVEAGRLQEVRVRVFAAGSPLPAANNASVSLAQLGVSLEPREASLPFYGDPALDGILKLYTETLPDQTFLFPLHALHGLRDLSTLAGGDLLVVATDKGFSVHPPGIAAETADVALHDASFSLMVNFHALGAWVAARGGEAIQQPGVQAISTSVFLLGAPARRFPALRATLAAVLRDQAPADLLILLNQSLPLLPDGVPELLLAALNLARWDPALVAQNMPQLTAAARGAGPELRRALEDGMHRCAGQFYHLPGVDSALAHAGTIFQELGEYAQALEYYRRSLAWFGDEEPELYANTLYNMGLCFHRLGEREEALALPRGGPDRSTERHDGQGLDPSPHGRGGRRGVSPSPACGRGAGGEGSTPCRSGACRRRCRGR